MSDTLREFLVKKHGLDDSVSDKILETTYADEISVFRAGQQEATERLKNCLNCKKRIMCKLWHMVSGLPVEDTVNYHCVCKDKWELEEECEEI